MLIQNNSYGKIAPHGGYPFLGDPEEKRGKEVSKPVTIQLVHLIQKNKKTNTSTLTKNRIRKSKKSKLLNTI